MKIQLIRHATLYIELSNYKILVDPCFCKKGTMASIKTQKGCSKKNPLCDLPINDDEVRELIKQIDFIIITHLHMDHFSGFDEFPEIFSKKILCQSSDKKKLFKLGFQDVEGIVNSAKFKDINITKTKTKHGGFLVRKILGHNSGYILESGDDSIYIAGDSIWNQSMNEILMKNNLKVIVLNGGAANVAIGRNITMNFVDICKVLENTNTSTIVPIHMDAFNHCSESRFSLINQIKDHPSKNRIEILENGEILEVV